MEGYKILQKLKYFRQLTIFTLLALFLLPVFICQMGAKAATTHDSDYNWREGPYIEVKSEDDKYQPTNNPVDIIENGSFIINDYPRTRYQYFESKKVSSDITSGHQDLLPLHSYIAVDKTDISLGFHFKLDTAITYDPPIKIKIYNTPAGPVYLIISIGNLAGQIFGQDTESWKNKPEDILEKGSVYIEKKGADGAYELANNDPSYYKIDVKKTNNKYSYSFSLSPTKDFAGLDAGDYRLTYYYASDADCDTGKPDGVDVFSLLTAPTTIIELIQDAKRELLDCYVEYKGSNEFSLEQVPGGAGKITLSPSNDGPNETAFYGLPSTTSNQSGTTAITTDEGIDIDVKESFNKKNLFEDVLKDAAKTVLIMINSGLEEGGEWINNMLVEGNDLEENYGVQSIWEKTRNMALSLLTLGLLIIAFMNILNIQVDQFNITRMVPKLIIGVVLTFFSYLIAAFLLDFMSALQALLFQATDGNYFSLSTSEGNIIKASTVDAFTGASAMGQVLLLVIFGMALFLVTLWIVVILVVRVAMLYFLVAIAPIAFIASILPWTEKYYKQWWATFWKWAFIGPGVAFMLWLSGSFLVEGYFKSLYGKVEPDGLESWIWLIAASVMLFLAAALPLKMGGEIYGAIQKGAKGAWGNKHNPIKNRLDMRTKSRDEARSMKLRKSQARLAQGNALKRFGSGMNKQQAVGARAGLKGELEKELGSLNPADLQAMAESGKGLEGETAQDMLAASGRLDVSKNAAFAEKMVERAQRDGSFGAKLGKEQKDFYASATMSMSAAAAAKTHIPAAANLTNAMEQANKSLEGRAEDMTATSFEYMAKHNIDALATFAKDEKAMDTISKSGKQKAKASLGRALQHAASTPAGAAIINPAVASHAAGSDGAKAVANVIEQDANWTTNHAAPDATGNVWD